jgi:hypothetical protein
VKPLTKLSQSENSWILAEDVSVLFAHIETICKVSSIFLEDLEKVLANWTAYAKLGGAFKTMVTNSF